MFYVEVKSTCGVEMECDLTVKVRARTWEHAGGAVAWLRHNAPSGYRVEMAQITPTTSSGRRCHMTVALYCVDDRETELDVPRAKRNSSLVLFAAMAQGQAVIPSNESLETPTL